MNLTQHLEHLDEHGYTVIKGFVDPMLTAAIRDHINHLLGPVATGDQKPQNGIKILRHPIPGDVMAPLAWNPKLLEVACATLRVTDPADLRLCEQVLIRSDPVPPPYEVSGWHIDQVFPPSEYEATPRRTYFHMVHCLNTVPAGGAAFTIVPGSHKLTYARTAKLKTIDELKAFQKNVIAEAGIDLSKQIPVLAEEGDLLIFNPMALHSASRNSTETPRYVYFASFFHKDAAFFKDRLAEYHGKPKYDPHFLARFPANRKDMVYQY